MFIEVRRRGKSLDAKKFIEKWSRCVLGGWQIFHCAVAGFVETPRRVRLCDSFALSTFPPVANDLSLCAVLQIFAARRL